MGVLSVYASVGNGGGMIHKEYDIRREDVEGFLTDNFNGVEWYAEDVDPDVYTGSAGSLFLEANFKTDRFKGW